MLFFGCIDGCGWNCCGFINVCGLLNSCASWEWNVDVLAVISWSDMLGFLGRNCCALLLTIAAADMYWPLSEVNDWVMCCCWWFRPVKLDVAVVLGGVEFGLVVLPPFPPRNCDTITDWLADNDDDKFGCRLSWAESSRPVCSCCCCCWGGACKSDKRPYFVSAALLLLLTGSFFTLCCIMSGDGWDEYDDEDDEPPSLSKFFFNYDFLEKFFRHKNNNI